MKTIELTLCHRCASIYYSMKDRIIIRKDYTQNIKEPCDICRVGKGWEFVIEVKQ